MRDLEDAVGQFVVYHDVLSQTDPQRTLFLAVRKQTFAEVFETGLGKLLVDKGRLRLLVFDEHAEEVVRWIP
jgi:hypothetical protein